MNNYIKDYTRSRKIVDSGFQRYMVKLYIHMTFGLLITAITASASFTFLPLTNLLFTCDQWGNIINRTLLGYIIMFAPFCIAMYVSNNFSKASFVQSRLLLGIYAALTGISLSELGYFYTIDSLHKTFLITAFTFGAMSFYGYTTNRDLSSVGSFCMMGIWGIIISSIVNIFIGNSMIYFLTSFIGVILFIVFVAYNTQKLKILYYELQDTGLVEKASLMGAFLLYINFLNLFFIFVTFFGKTKEKRLMSIIKNYIIF